MISYELTNDCLKWQSYYKRQWLHEKCNKTKRQIRQSELYKSGNWVDTV